MIRKETGCTPDARTRDPHFASGRPCLIETRQAQPCLEGHRCLRRHSRASPCTYGELMKTPGVFYLGGEQALKNKEHDLIGEGGPCRGQ
eukprot:2086972-Heterocapsa_arctica.AAC.1